MLGIQETDWNFLLSNSSFHFREYPRIQVIWPISKKLMCGDTGVGAMEEPAKIAKTIESIINKKKLKYGVNFCMSMAITAGCTFGLAMIIVRSLMRSWK